MFEKVLVVSTKCERCGYPLHVNSTICRNVLTLTAMRNYISPTGTAVVSKIFVKGDKIQIQHKGVKSFT